MRPCRAWASTTTSSVLTDPDIWAAMQATAHFLFWTILLQTLLGFTLAYLIDRRFRGHGFWTTVILIPMMLSPAVVGNFWAFLYQPQIGLVQLHRRRSSPAFRPSLVRDDRLGQAGAVVDHHRRHLDVDALRDADLPRRTCARSRTTSTKPPRSTVPRQWRQFWSITLPMALPFIMLAVLFRGIENFKMFDMVNLLTCGGPGSTTEVASITLKREAFEKWRTGYSSAFAIILFVSVFGLANIYVKALNRVKNRWSCHAASATAHSVVEPSPRVQADRRRAGRPLRADHDGAAGLDLPDRLQDRRPDSIAYPPKVVFTAIARRLLQPVHHAHRGRRRIHRAHLPPATGVLRRASRASATWSIAGPSNYAAAFHQLADHRLRLDRPRRSSLGTARGLRLLALQGTAARTICCSSSCRRA